ncbi:MAG TPA: hypothetical protein VLX32_13880 [Candidatus Acidoferrum sp.]|nr:hypothetical protein [Candidatus Acidoferrum sp.]
MSPNSSPLNQAPGSRLPEFAQTEEMQSPVSWRERLVPRCSAPDCARANKLFPSWRRRSSGVLLDGRWYCGSSCASGVLSFRVQNLISGFVPPKQRAHRLPIGLLLVDRGAISHSQLQEALRRQRESRRGRLGNWLLQLGYVSDVQLAAALGQQWGCPVFPLTSQPVSSVLPSMAPFTLFQNARAVPVHVSADGRFLHVAFCERMDHTLLYALEQMLGVRTVGCVATEASVLSALEALSPLAPREEISFDTLRDPREITSTISSYAAELRARKLILVRVASFLWTRFLCLSSRRDLLFRILPGGFSNPEQSPGSPNVTSLSADSRNDGISAASGVV